MGVFGTLSQTSDSPVMVVSLLVALKYSISPAIVHSAIPVPACD